MLTRLFETLLISLINCLQSPRSFRAGRPARRGILQRVLNALCPAGRREDPAGQAAPVADEPVVLGEVIPSALEALRRGEANPSPLTLSPEVRRRHLYLLGGTGAGKTNLLLQLLIADVEAGRAVCLIDARGDLVDRALRCLAARQDAEALRDRLLLLDLRGQRPPATGGGEYVVGFNPLAQAGGDPYTRALFVLDVLRQQWGAALGVQTEETLRNCLLALTLSEQGGTLLDIEPMLTDSAFRRRVLASIADGSVRRFWERFEALPGPQQLQWTTPVLNKVSPWLARPSLRLLLGQRAGVDLRAFLDGHADAVVLVCLGADELFGAAQLVGSLVVSAVAGAVMRTDRPAACRHPLLLYLDEFENFGGAGEQFEAIISEGRRFGLGLTLSHQASSQLSPRLRNLIRNVVATQVFFATGGLDADTLAGEIPSDEPKTVIRNLLMSQKVGEALVTRRGQPFARLRTKHAPDPDVPPARIAALAAMALQTHGHPQADVERELRRYDPPASGASPLPDGGRAQAYGTRAAPRKNVGPAMNAVSETTDGPGVPAETPAYEVREAPPQSSGRARKNKPLKYQSVKEQHEERQSP